MYFMTKKSYTTIGIALLVIVCSIVITTKSSIGQELPGSVEPGRFSDRIIKKPFFDFPELPELPAQEEEIYEQPAEIAKKFILNDLHITGVTAFSSQALTPLYKDYLGKEIDIATLYTIAANITRLYQQEKYFLSRALIPEQEIKDGKATIAVVEGYISHIRVDYKNHENFLTAGEIKILDEIKEHILRMKPLNASALDHYLLLLSDLRGVDAAAILEPLPVEMAQPGAAGMVLTVTPKPSQFAVNVDNFGSRFTGPYESTLSSEFYPHLTNFDSLSFAGLASIPLNEVKYISTGYTSQLNPDGTSIGLRLGYSQAEPGYSLALNEIVSKAYQGTITLSQPLIRSRQKNLTLGSEFDVKNIDSDLLKTELYRDRVRSIRFSASLNAMDRFNGNTNTTVTLSHGLEILGGRPTGAFNLSRREGRGDYTKISGNSSRIQYVDSNSVLVTSFSGQFAWSPLLSSEEFGYGGQSFGRAYDPSEIIGEHGAAALIEWRYSGIPSYEGISLQPFTFYDIGKVWNMDDNFNDDDAGVSAGLGVRLYHKGGVKGSFYAAYPLTRKADNPFYGNGKNPRFLFQLGYTF